MSSPRVLITGITGQDGSHLADVLLEHGYEIHGTLRPERDPGASLGRVDHLRDHITLHRLDLTNAASVRSLVAAVAPDELYHLAANSVVAHSWEDPVAIGDLDGLGTVRVLEAVRLEAPEARLCFASSSEVFGDPAEVPQRESTPVRPRSPYGAAKAYGQQLVGMARCRHGLHACNAILFNHEGPRRGHQFVTRRVTRGVASIALGLSDRLTVGDLTACRDWGRATDYVEAMHRMVSHPEPDDYVLATGTTHSVRELVETAFECAKVPMEGHVEVDPDLVRPSDSAQLVGDPTRARERLGWEPQTDFRALVADMVKADLDELRAGGQPEQA